MVARALRPPQTVRHTAGLSRWPSAVTVDSKLRSEDLQGVWEGRSPRTQPNQNTLRRRAVTEKAGRTVHKNKAAQVAGLSRFCFVQAFRRLHRCITSQPVWSSSGNCPSFFVRPVAYSGTRVELSSFRWGGTHSVMYALMQPKKMISCLVFRRRARDSQGDCGYYRLRKLTTCFSVR